ncbi:MAG: GAF domain-containing protein [Candidatus Marinimicrobia bacterium]|nr:GAF domain-containing protein [Candidatus Neomarinimicrobiota bacterium]MCF7827806.1 GAF domain-containing protein [Candidatus Neomarinimicrobiota bacterium]MCF7879439.1 GAF domain-containing protein [Candidatus Neomarinimicrobiota bacterium]
MARDSLTSQLESLADDAPDPDSFCTDAVRLIKQSNGKYDWVGIYASRENRLSLPESWFQGATPEHTEISFDEGICGAAARERNTVVVDDVNSDPRYLACSIFTQSEIVVPILSEDGTLYGVLDLDSDTPAAFQSEEQQSLENAAAIIARYFSTHQN